VDEEEEKEEEIPVQNEERSNKPSDWQKNMCGRTIARW
jgi:hypothetical protein